MSPIVLNFFEYLSEYFSKYFLHPILLLLLLLLIPLWFWKGRKGHTSALRFSSISTLVQMGGQRKSGSRGVLTTLRLLSLALIIIALARPQIGTSTIDVETSGIDIMLLVDISGSMESLDFQLNGQPCSRIEVVKSVVSQFIDERANDRLGLIVFSGYPYMVSPLTLDHSWLHKRLDAIKIGTTEDGTAIGSGIASAINRLRDQTSKSRIIILLTDGMNNSGKIPPLAAAEAAEALGIKVYTIGAGTRGEAPIPVIDSMGQKRLVLAKVDIDESTLVKIALMTGGQYFRAFDTDSLKKIYADINQMEQTKHTIHKFEQREELFQWFAIPAIFLLLVEALLGKTIYRTLP